MRHKDRFLKILFLILGSLSIIFTVRITYLFISSRQPQLPPPSLFLPKESYNLAEMEKEITIINSSNLSPAFYIDFNKRIEKETIHFVLAESQTPFTRYFPEEDPGQVEDVRYIFIPSSPLFPTKYIASLSYKEEGSKKLTEISKRFLIRYYDDFSDNIKKNPLWDSRNPGIETIPTGGILIKPYKERLLSQLVFRHRFEKNIVCEFTFIPLSSVVNLQFFIGEAYSFFIGDGDNRTINLRKAMWSEELQKKIEIVAASINLEESFKPKERHTLKIEKIDNMFSLYSIKQKGKQKKILTWEETSPKLIITEKHKLIGLAVWRDSEGVEIKNILINQP